MYTLKESTEYALSTEGKSNKTFLFVKLTDSALQSILSLKSQENATGKPTIQFENDKGTLSLPANGESRNYNFTLSAIETIGLQGSFQCVQHAENRSLESLGAMLMKIQIKAKEDSYEQTRFKMTVADKEQKSFCTKEIKPNGAHRTRKVRIRHSSSISSLEVQHPVANKPELFKHPNLPTFSALQQQPLRKRIIHILAVKSYKKPELLLRLIKDGLNEAEKKEFNTLLLSVASLKGNMYNLRSHLWKEVEDDWKFCAKQELQLMHRRKQQFLKSAIEDNSQDSLGKISTKSNASESSSTELEPLNKKRRISRFAINNDEIKGSNSSEIKSSSLNMHQNPTNSLPITNGSCDKTGKKTMNGFHTSQRLKKNSGDQNSNAMPSTDISSVSDTFKCKKSRFVDSKSIPKKIIADANRSNGSLQNGKTITDLLNSMSGVKKGASSYSLEELKKYANYKKASTPINRNNGRDVAVFDISNRISPVSSGNTFLLSPANKESKNHVDSGSKDSSIENVVSEFNYPDIIKEYPPIKSKEQRSQYVNEYDSQYEDYLKLHTQMRDVSEKFIDLENQLKTCEEGSKEYKKIRAKMHLECTLTLQNIDYINAWKKFNILQSKLSHIKRIIKEYDIACCKEV